MDFIVVEVIDFDVAVVIRLVALENITAAEYHNARDAVKQKKPEVAGQFPVTAAGSDGTEIQDLSLRLQL